MVKLLMKNIHNIIISVNSVTYILASPSSGTDAEITPLRELAPTLVLADICTS